MQDFRSWNGTGGGIRVAQHAFAPACRASISLRFSCNEDLHGTSHHHPSDCVITTWANLQPRTLVPPQNQLLVKRRAAESAGMDRESSRSSLFDSPCLRCSAFTKFRMLSA